MTTGFPGFDDRLNELLATQAEKSGLSPEAYIRRAVVDQIVRELSEDPDSEVGALLRVLQEGVDNGVDPIEATRVFGTPIDDPDRLAAVTRTGLMDTDSDAGYDRVVAMVADALSVPSAAFSLLDDKRQYFKSALGLPAELGGAQEVPLDGSICRYAIDLGQPLVVEDARLNDMLKDHPSVQGNLLVSYLGVPLTDDEGHSVGTLCVWDQQPRQWTTGHVQILQDLAWIIRERIFE
ncbi:GAF domain-containing protein [Rhodococcus sp. 15-725-2-2b]|jgi:GAF domain-containing protein|uniref:GAF domain-containing protein n=1 Tax=unclassified Rhodococcus (in: high G+C Gram-positive bacteria) TaxID=192944 RepID=UPI000B9B00A1|nr:MULTISPECIES: GAF domain-containing protein [unclassified Rhodococcus (in: high G+C Gram-positive bacteria)]OZC64680.1 GAF domain-containing protein [Rhodococcus sp. 06-469-3-2]OZC70239.1 GAF domain-containing protein [Rhodococcus sp. 06-470-2]OZC80391.1 GAF domain-containing protein [Rhodococcus sp. 06-418-5]OZD43499.1 GAF domain-containing protein [Rhodococcus sp. 06-1477-1A]OZE13423.1 GAF domain-containing protein [Rhodococcus sp. 05-2255-3C]